MNAPAASALSEIPAPGAALSLNRPRRFPTVRPATAFLRRLMGRTAPDICDVAFDQWQVARGSPVEVRRARFLPGQLDRISGAEFGTVEQVCRDFRGGYATRQRATLCFSVRDVLLHDGVLYAGGAVRHLRRRSSYFPAAFPIQERDCISLYESWLGNRWFGNWLSDDCLAYRLAERFAQPFTSGQPTGHKQEYEHRLGMRPLRGTSIWFREVILFDDTPHNEGKRERAEGMRQQLVSGGDASHPGVFLLRGQTGDSRVLLNEAAIAEQLASRRGFQVLDPSSASVEQIARACAGAKVVAGVEGSHLVHGIVTMPPDACALVIQPPTRAVSALKLLTDRQGQDYALVVGKGASDAFTVDPYEVERTLDLL